jgi:transcriptional regulator with XRE-family HTH domain
MTTPTTPPTPPPPPLRLGRTVSAIRERLGLSREAMADRLRVSHATMDEIEANAVPTPEAVVDRFREAYDLDLYSAAWSLFGDNSRLPARLQGPASALQAGMDQRLAGYFEENGPGERGEG